MCYFMRQQKTRWKCRIDSTYSVFHLLNNRLIQKITTYFSTLYHIAFCRIHLICMNTFNFCFPWVISLTWTMLQCTLEMFDLAVCSMYAFSFSILHFCAMVKLKKKNIFQKTQSWYEKYAHAPINTSKTWQNQLIKLLQKHKSFHPFI